tara:strand:+ start:47 stop:553 length:507 start_codon:yes stop_codon:yes gene_type:complete
MIEIVLEIKEDSEKVEFLLDMIFSPERKMLSSYRLREGVSKISSLSFVARDKFKVVVGVVRCWPILIGENNSDALLIGPVAVHPTLQSEGIGSLLLKKVIKNAITEGWVRAVLVGDIAYYSRFGFTNDKKKLLKFPLPINHNRLLKLELKSGSFDGVFGIVKSWKIKL